MEHYREASIGILGAGTKGKLCAELLLDSELAFSWHDYEHEKYGAGLFGQKILDYSEIRCEQLLIAIYPRQRKELESFLQGKGYIIGENAWYV